MYPPFEQNRPKSSLFSMFAVAVLHLGLLAALIYGLKQTSFHLPPLMEDVTIIPDQDTPKHHEVEVAKDIPVNPIKITQTEIPPLDYCYGGCPPKIDRRIEEKDGRIPPGPGPDIIIDRKLPEVFHAASVNAGSCENLSIHAMHFGMVILAWLR